MSEKRFKCHVSVVGVHIGVGTDEHELTGDECRNLLNQYVKENEQLRQRNDKQAKQLDNLYHLIEKEDWKTLKGIIQEFQECEEQLRREESTYCKKSRVE